MNHHGTSRITMYGHPFVPSGFIVPTLLEFGAVRLRMLTIDDLDKDYEAVMASRERLKGLFGPDGAWPDGLTKKDDLIDLAWHQREFTLRRSFAYTLMSQDESVCLGCAYVFPSVVQAYDAFVFYWARSGEDADDRDRELGGQLRQWLQTAWPFKRIAFPGRDTPWAEVRP